MTKQSDYVVVLNRKDRTGEAGIILSYFNHPHTFTNWDFVVKRGDTVDMFDKGDDGLNIFKDLQEITFDEWQNLPDCEPVQPIYGYKLAKPQYHEAVKAILIDEDAENWFDEYFDTNLTELGCNFKISEDESSINQTLKKSGVLDLWFEPVFEEDLKREELVEDEPEINFEFSFGTLTDSDINKLRDLLNND